MRKKVNYGAPELWVQCFLRGQIHGENSLKYQVNPNFIHFLKVLQDFPLSEGIFIVNGCHSTEFPSNSSRKRLSLPPSLHVVAVFVQGRGDMM